MKFVKSVYEFFEEYKYKYKLNEDLNATKFTIEDLLKDEKKLKEFKKQIKKGYVYLNDLNLTSLEGFIGEDLNQNIEFLSLSNNKLKNLKGGPNNVLEYNLNFNNLESLEGISKNVQIISLNYNNLKSLDGLPSKMADVYATHNNLETLKGSPQEIEGFFDVSNNNLKILEGGPIKVIESYNASNNGLINLKGSPREVGEFIISNNKLESLEGAPIIVNNLDISDNPTLKTTKGIPKKINGWLNLSKTIKDSSIFTNFPEYVYGPIIFSNDIDLVDVYDIIKNIKIETNIIIVGNKKYKKEEISEIVFDELKNHYKNKKDILLNNESGVENDNIEQSNDENQSQLDPSEEVKTETESDSIVKPINEPADDNIEDNIQDESDDKE